MATLRCELPKEVTRVWSAKMTLSEIKLFGREGDLHCQPERVENIARGLGIEDRSKIHVLQPPATADQPGWRRVTDTYASSGVMTLNAEGGILPGAGHCLVVPARGSHVLYVENLKTRRAGVARVKEESLSHPSGCCGPATVVQALLSRLEACHPELVRAYITGSGPREMIPAIVEHLELWGIKKAQVATDGLRHEKELGLSNRDDERPEQDWNITRQIRMR